MEEIRLVDAANRAGLIQDRTFEDCLILGPAILLAMTRGGPTWTYEDLTIDGPLEAIVYELAETRSEFVGVIACENVIFRRCTFRGIGLLGKRGFLAQMEEFTV